MKAYNCLSGTFDVNAISKFILSPNGGQSGETTVVRAIVQVLTLCHEYDGGNRVIQSAYFDVSLVTLLSPGNMCAALDEAELEQLTIHGQIEYRAFAAYMTASIFPVQGVITGALGVQQPQWDGMFSTILWAGGPSFCVVNDGTYAFRTRDFPSFKHNVSC